MRSIYLFLFDATVGEADACLAGARFERPSPDPPGYWYYPQMSGAVLYAHCAKYDPHDPNLDPESHLDVQRCCGGRAPTVVTIDVSGRVPGDTEVRHAVESILSRFDGLAFDDATFPNHGWTLAEILSGATFEGFRFFDYAGWHERSRTKSQL